MNCLDLGADDRALLTADHEATNLHAVSRQGQAASRQCWLADRPVEGDGGVGAADSDEVRESLLTRRRVPSDGVELREGDGKDQVRAAPHDRQDHHPPGSPTSLAGRSARAASQVPYSEHSSFNEMRDFVQWLQPSRIIPSVGNDEGPKRDRMLSWLRQRPLT